MQVGEHIPDYLGTDETGKEWYSRELLGKRWVLYFYPKDNTSGCTAEACSLRDARPNWDKWGLPVIGVSKDSAASHLKFKEKFSLPFPLIADTDTTLQQAMGVWVEKSMYGKKYMGTLRTTFIIGPDGTIEHKMEGKAIRTAEHADQIARWVEEHPLVQP